VPSRLRLLIGLFVSAPMLVHGQADSGPWIQSELTEPFMRALTKSQCMDKSVAALKAGSISDNDLKTLGGITGDCVVWARGQKAAFCKTYAKDYIGRFCVTNALDARSCVLVHMVKDVYCK